MALAERERLKTIVGSPAHSVFGDDGDETAVGTSTEAGGAPPSPSRKHPSTPLSPQLYPHGSHDEPPFLEEEAAPPRPLHFRILFGLKEFLLSLLTPPTISLVTALVCALVTKLKAVTFFLRSETE